MKKTMKKTVFAFVLLAALVLSLAACGTARPTETEAPAVEPQSAAPQESEPTDETRPANTMTAYRADGSAVILEDGGDGTTWIDENGLLYYLGEDGVLRARGFEDLYTETPSAESEPVRQDGERFEAVIILEGMEEPVQYEHVRNTSLGFEMDYDYENFVRSSDAERERFISDWDDPANPDNFLEITFSAEDAETAAAAVREALSASYELNESVRELERAGSCIRIEASVIKGTENMADQIQVVTIIPAADGCCVATEHYSIESAEGIGRRFSYMLNTLSLLEK